MIFQALFHLLGNVSSISESFYSQFQSHLSCLHATQWLVYALVSDLLDQSGHVLGMIIGIIMVRSIL